MYVCMYVVIMTYVGEYKYECEVDFKLLKYILKCTVCMYVLNMVKKQKCICRCDV